MKNKKYEFSFKFEEQAIRPLTAQIVNTTKDSL